ncbi:cobalt-precorrin-6A reductase [Rhodospirillaceae bacterium SYSU D60014]|uniref:cobalt-precorrin-6A reductase n=1 Tax=Virgifigura deserti TaxID=2268457 RepID=UPI000E663D0C
MPLLSERDHQSRVRSRPAAGRRRLLILGGTGEAAALADALSAHDNIEPITSLAGRTAAPAAPAGAVRVGGFGGVSGLLGYLRTESIDLVIDATHPFAQQITRNATIACWSAEVPLLRLERPLWPRHPDDIWHEVSTLVDAAAAVPKFGTRAFLTVGAGELQPFAGLPQVWFLVRLIDAPPNRLPLADYEVVLGRGPFSAAKELRLLDEQRIDVVVAKHSGGEATYGKIAAARALGLPVILLHRPILPPAERPETEVGTVDEALAWVEAQLT